MNRTLTVLRHATAIVSSLGLSLLLVEFGLRLVWDGFFIKSTTGFTVTDSMRGWKNKPNISLHYTVAEFDTVITHNARGYRSANIEPSRNPCNTRIVILGDSFTYGLGVQDDETFSALLDQNDTTREVLNMGVKGYGTNQELLTLVYEGLAFDADLYVLAMFGNDFDDNVISPFARFELDDGALVYPKPATEESLAAFVANERRKSEHRTGLRYSYAYRFFSDRLKLGRWLFRSALGSPPDRTPVRTPFDQRDEAWALQEALMVEVARLVTDSGAKILIVVIPLLQQVQPSLRYARAPTDAVYYHDQILEIAARRRIPTLGLLPALRAAYQTEGKPLYHPHDAHLNARGHRVVAAAIETAIEHRELLPDKASHGQMLSRDGTCS